MWGEKGSVWGEWERGIKNTEYLYKILKNNKNLNKQIKNKK